MVWIAGELVPDWDPRLHHGPDAAAGWEPDEDGPSASEIAEDTAELRKKQAADARRAAAAVNAEAAAARRRDRGEGS